MKTSQILNRICRKYILAILPLVMLIACGPSREEIEARERAKNDSILSNAKEIEVKEIPVKYYVASEFNLVPGKIVGWAPTDEDISQWKCSGGDEQDGIIYIHLQDESGKVSVYTCDHKAWVNLHTGDILK